MCSYFNGGTNRRAFDLSLDLTIWLSAYRWPLLGLIGEGDRGPVQVPIAMGDSATGVSAAMAVGFALLHRERNGEGQHIDCSLLDTYVQMHEELIPRVSIRGKEAIPPRSGSQHFNGGPTGVFDAGDGSYIQIMVMPYQWKRIVAAMDMPQLADDPKIQKPSETLGETNRYELEKIIGDRMASLLWSALLS